MKPFLVIDVGNTSTKIGLIRSGRISRTMDIPTTSLFRSGTRLPFTTGIHGAIIASVVPRVKATLRKLLKHAGVFDPIFVSSKLDLGIGIRYPRPATIGADRLVNAVAAVALQRTPAIVLDFGTAVTFDVISARGEYLGGVIAPGLRVLTDYLHEHTALLPSISIREPSRAIGKSTIEAMRSGAVIGYRGLIREILRSVKKELGTRSRIHVIATGGHGALIASRIPEIGSVDPQLTLKGLMILYGRLKRRE